MNIPNAAIDQIEDGMGIPVVLRFVPTSCKIVLNEHSNDDIPPAIVMEIQLGRRDNLRSSDGKNMGKVKWTMDIYRGGLSRERLKVKGAIGMVDYIKEYESTDFYIEESCCAWAHIPESSFAILLDFVMSGRLPNTIAIHAFGSIRHGWEPDGSGKDWDLESEKATPISKVEIDMGLSQKTESTGEDDEVAEPLLVQQLFDFEQRFIQLVKSQVRSINWNLGWITLLLLVLVVISSFKA